MGRLLTVAVALLLFASSLGVVFSTHQARRLFVELQGLQKVRDEQNTQWGRLQLEQSTWATHGRIETVANEQLDMVIPPPGSVVIVRP
ncbi:MAG: cell division protein FtsL [Gammaproteobacteria bacterium]|nr:cell division protein FtsL [Gammaproteobacteria bacterium]